MLTLKLINALGEVVTERSHEQETYLAMKQYIYEEGDSLVLEVSKPNQFLWVQMDEALQPSLIYLKQTSWTFSAIVKPLLRRAYSPKIFSGERHYLRARFAEAHEIHAYRNLALNPHDQKIDSGAYPHASANVETRDDSTFFARNAIDGMLANESHGSFPYQSWGINQQKDAEISIDFGRPVLVDKIALVLRADFPHDSYWTEATVAFSSGEELVIHPKAVQDRQFFSFEKRETTKVTLKNLIKNVDDSPFPALTEFEIYGVESNEK